jgi:hypothetical protein
MDQVFVMFEERTKVLARVNGMITDFSEQEKTHLKDLETAGYIEWVADRWQKTQRGKDALEPTGTSYE